MLAKDASFGKSVSRKTRNAADWAQFYTLPAKASNYIQPLEIVPGESVLLWCRVSKRQQRKKGNLARQEANLRQSIEQQGGIVIGVENFDGSGTDPYCLIRAACRSRQLGVRLVAECTNRFLRAHSYHSKNNPKAQPSVPEFQDFARVTEGLTLMTVLHPDATESAQRGYQSRRGQQENRGGRPKNKQRCKPGDYTKRQQEATPLVAEMRKQGLSYREIAGKLKCFDDRFPTPTAKTIWNWVNGV